MAPSYDAFMFITLVVFMVSPLTTAQKSPPINLTPTPAPAPAPDTNYINLTDRLSVAGPFSTFLKYLQQTKVIDTLQNQANNTDQGVTVFVPTDDAFSGLKKPSLSNVSNKDLKSLLLFHALPKYYSLAEFNNLSKSNPVSTLAGGQFQLNLTYVSGTVHVDSGWSNPKISSSVVSTKPVALYEIQRVLIPEAIFGAAPPPAPAPAPSPESGKAADSPTGPDGADSPKSSTPNSVARTVGSDVLTYLVLAISGGVVLLL